MSNKKIICLILTCAFLLTGCSVSKETQAATNATTVTSETAVQTTVKQKLEYNPHPYSKKLSERIPQENWDALYNLSDAIRKGETSFKCASEEAYKWCTDITVLCCLIPPAGTKIEGKSDDGSPAFENGTGKIHYNMPADEYVKRQADFEKIATQWLDESKLSSDFDLRVKSLYGQSFIAYDGPWADSEMNWSTGVAKLTPHPERRQYQALTELSEFARRNASRLPEYITKCELIKQFRDR